MKTKINAHLTKESLNILDGLIKDLHINTDTELFNIAFSILIWAVKQRKKGRKIFAGSGTSIYPLSLAELDKIQENKKENNLE